MKNTIFILCLSVLFCACTAAVKNESQQEYFTQALSRTSDQIEKVWNAFEEIAPCPSHPAQDPLFPEIREDTARMVKELAKSYPATLNTALESYAIYLAALYPYQNNTFAPDSLEHQSMKRELPQILEETQSAAQDIVINYQDEILKALQEAQQPLQFAASCGSITQRNKMHLAILKPMHESAVKDLGATYTKLYKNLPKKDKEENLKQCVHALRPYNAQLYKITITGKNTQRVEILNKIEELLKECTKK